MKGVDVRDVFFFRHSLISGDTPDRLLVVQVLIHLAAFPDIKDPATGTI